ncbi:hypothetical protein ACSCB1_36120 [Streptomyces europaeiscabiei]|uniref:hypothetical protein n=2 Tax=Streptomyces europaeiscabiei TaxID=146819 RepID=UPI0029AF09BA|nr:hypothetical protein [Streptomyces europaeiscabiei]
MPASAASLSAVAAMKPSPPPAMSGRHWKERLRHRFGTTALDAARILLADLLDDLGGAAAVQRREVRPPR